MTRISKNNLSFLNDLKKNNNRDWFTDNKELYTANRESIILFADDLLDKVKTHDNIETVSGKKSLHRIYRDIRFSKDKTPYKTIWSGSFKRATKLLRGGYYFHIEPGNSFLGGGFWGPSSGDLKLIRNNILDYGDELKTIINSTDFITNFGKLEGDQLKTAPKGFDKEHEHIDLLRFKQLIVVKRFTDEEVLSNEFSSLLSNGIKAMRPFFDYMSEALSTDSNGEKLY
jgi:uncharacterized protein (TIGR02453 family)